MKKTLITVGTLVLAAVFVLCSLNVNPVSAQSEGYAIQNVDYQVQVLYSAHVIIRETITLSGQTDGTFLLGFPYKYGNHILKGVAFDQTGTLAMNIGVQLGDRSGFYGAEITLPNPQPQVFTVIFILSNDLLTTTSAGNSLDFPAYPSFTKDVAKCAVAFTLPSDPTSITITKPDGDVNATSYVKQNLAAFTNAPATASFTVATNTLQQIDMKNLNRVITADPTGAVGAVDKYRITNNSPNVVSSLHVDIPNNASNVVAKDENGRTLSVSTTAGNDLSVVDVGLQTYVSSGQSASITVQYNLPSTIPQSTQSTFDLDLFPVKNYYVDNASVQIVLPEGAHFTAPQLSTLDPSVSMTRSLFQESLQVNRQGVSAVDRIVPTETNLQVAYDYNLLWLSFRPTFWVWGLFVAGSIIYTIYRRPKAPTSKKTAVPRLSAGLSPDNVRAFTDAYEERRNITHEIRLLHARAQKGKIPRSYYKSQRKTLETRLAALSKNINQLKGTFRAAGGSFADLIRQLDAAENEVEKARGVVRAAEARHRSGEMPIDEYKEALANYQQKREKIDLQISGILLRLRAEIH